MDEATERMGVSAASSMPFPKAFSPAKNSFLLQNRRSGRPGLGCGQKARYRNSLFGDTIRSTRTYKDPARLKMRGGLRRTTVPSTRCLRRPRPREPVQRAPLENDRRGDLARRLGSPARRLGPCHVGASLVRLPLQQKYLSGP